MNQLNRSLYLQSNLIQSARKVPSVTPTKNPSMTNITKIRIRSRERQPQETPSQNPRNNDHIYNLLSTNRANSNISSQIKKQNVHDSLDRKRKGSPHDKSPMNNRITTIHKSKQTSVSQSQLALNQVLAQMQINQILENENFIPPQRKQTYTTHIESNQSQKSALNSHILTTSSSNKPQRIVSVSFEDYSKLLKDLNQYTLQVKYLKQRVNLQNIKVQLFEQVNKKITTQCNQCGSCSQKMDAELSELLFNIQNFEIIQENDIAIDVLNDNRFQYQDDLFVKSINNINQSANSLDNSRPQKLINDQEQSFAHEDQIKVEDYKNAHISKLVSTYYAQQMNSIAQEYFDDYKLMEAENQFHTKVIQQNKHRHIPSSLMAFQLVDK